MSNFVEERKRSLADGVGNKKIALKLRAISVPESKIAEIRSKRDRRYSATAASSMSLRARSRREGSFSKAFLRDAAASVTLPLRAAMTPRR